MTEMRKQDLTRHNRPSHNRFDTKTTAGSSNALGGNRVLSEFDQDILVIKDYDEVKLQTLIAYDIIVLDYYHSQRASQLLRQIRSSVYDELYLKPTVLQAQVSSVDPVDEQMADGIISSSSIEPIFPGLQEIAFRTEEILKVSSDFRGPKILLKLIRFLYSRSKPLKPVPTPKSHMGYAFPFLDANISQHEYEELLHILDMGLKNDLLKDHFEDHVHLCNQCHSGFINYRETCPKCGTHKFRSQHTIHHFICGYVGPESDFISEDRLECPKCDRQLRHIGVDYDKPSLVMECENGHVFQETDMTTFCFHCHTEARPEELVTYPVNTYEITASGAEAAISGVDKQNEQATEPEGHVSLSVFKTFLKMEVERQKASGNPSTISYLHIMLCPATYKRHQEDFETFIREVARIVKNQLKPTEIVTLVNDEVFLIISPDSGVDETATHLGDVKSHTLSMIRGACDGNKSDNMVLESFELKAEGSKSILEKINQHIAIF